MKRKVATIVGWIVTAGLLASIALRVDLGAAMRGLSLARPEWLALAAGVNLAVVALRALRWKWLMLPQARAPYGTIFRATMIGFAGNNILPARGGDWYKIFLLRGLPGMHAPMLASITGLDKLFDGLAILALFGLLSLHSRFPLWIQRGTTIVSIVCAISLAICALLLLHHRRPPPERTDEVGALSRLAKRLGSGMGALASPRLVAATLALSVATCLLQVATIWCCQLAFGRHLDLWIPALVFVAINLAIIVPSAPSGLGPFEFAAVMAYGWLGVPESAALGIAIAYHAVQFFPVTAIGAIFHLWGASLPQRRPQGCDEGGDFRHGPVVASEREVL